MDPIKLGIFQVQVLLQCEYALRAHKDFETAFNTRTSNQELFYHAQVFLLAHANISKLLWGGGNVLLRNERIALRDSLHVGDAFQRNERTMRNNFEHFDERLDDWWEQSSSERRFRFDMNVGPLSMISNLSLAEKEMLRHYDPSTQKLIFFGDELDLPGVIARVAQLRHRAVEILQVSIS